MHRGGIHTCLVDDPNIEVRQTIDIVRLFDIEYLSPNDDIFKKEYRKDYCEPIKYSELDIRPFGKHKTIHWAYEAETRIYCRLDPPHLCNFDHILLRLKDDIFKGLVIVSNPWASDNFISEIKAV